MDIELKVRVTVDAEQVTTVGQNLGAALGLDFGEKTATRAEIATALETGIQRMLESKPWNSNVKVMAL